jgi:hypothetical protein
MIIAALRKAIAQLALGNLMQGWAAPETDLLCEAGLLPANSSATDRAVNSYCLPPSLSSYEVAERALWHAAQSLGGDSEWLEREASKESLVLSTPRILIGENRVPDISASGSTAGVRD